MSNIEALRSLIKDELIKDEANEFLDAIGAEIEILEGRIKTLEEEVNALEEEGKDEVQTESHTIGGLDVLHIGLDNENMEIRARVDTFITRLKQHYNGVAV